MYPQNPQGGQQPYGQQPYGQQPPQQGYVQAYPQQQQQGYGPGMQYAPGVQMQPLGQPMQQQPQPMYQQPMQQQQPMMQQQQGYAPQQGFSPQPQYSPQAQPSPQHQQPSATVAPAPWSPSGAQAIQPTSPSNTGADLVADKPASDGDGGAKKRKDPKLCFCIEPDSNLTEEELAKKYKWSVPCAIVSGLASFVMLIMAVIAYTRISNFTGAYDDIVGSWRVDPIYDVAPFVGACPAGWTRDSLTTRWEGTYDACVCSGQYERNSTDTSGCTTDQMAPPLNCQDRPGYPPVPLTIGSTLNLCIFRAGESALERDPPNEAGECDDDKRSCGADAASAFCVSTPTCPLTDLHIGTANVDVSSYGPRVTKTSLGVVGVAQQYLYKAFGGQLPDVVMPLDQRSPGSLPFTNMPLTNFELVHGKPCVISGGCYYGDRATEFAGMEALEKGSASGRGFKLKKGACSGCASAGSVSPGGVDIRYIRTFDRPEKAVYTEAGVPPHYITDSNTYEFTLQTRSEIRWSAKCEKSRADIEGQSNFVSHIRSFQIVLLVVSILTFLIFSLVLPCVEHKHQWRWSHERKNWYAKQALNVVFKAFVIAFTIATMVVSLGVLAYFSKVDGKTEQAKCSDPLSTDVFSILTDDYESLSYSNVGSSVAMGFSGVLDALGSVLWVCGK